jgi:hypothetical protein
MEFYESYLSDGGCKCSSVCARILNQCKFYGKFYKSVGLLQVVVLTPNGTSAYMDTGLVPKYFKWVITKSTLLLVIMAEQLEQVQDVAIGFWNGGLMTQYKEVPTFILKWWIITQ